MVVPRIGRTRLGHRTLKCVLTIGTQSAQSIRASGTSAAQTGRTHDRTRPMLQLRQKVLAKAPSTRDPKQALRLRDAQATAYRQSWRSSSTPLLSRASQNYLKKLASMLHREHVCIEIGDPLLALLRDSKVVDVRKLPDQIRSAY